MLLCKRKSRRRRRRKQKKLLNIVPHLPPSLSLTSVSYLLCQKKKTNRKKKESSCKYENAFELHPCTVRMCTCHWALETSQRGVMAVSVVVGVLFICREWLGWVSQSELIPYFLIVFSPLFRLLVFCASFRFPPVYQQHWNAWLWHEINSWMCGFESNPPPAAEFWRSRSCLC